MFDESIDRAKMRKLNFFKDFVDVYQSECSLDNTKTFHFFSEDLHLASIQNGGIQFNERLMAKQSPVKWKGWVLKDIAAVYLDIQLLERYWACEYESPLLNALVSLLSLYGLTPTCVDTTTRCLQELSVKSNFCAEGFIEVLKAQMITFHMWSDCRDSVCKLARTIHPDVTDDAALLLVTLSAIKNSSDVPHLLSKVELGHLSKYFARLSDSLYKPQSLSNLSNHTSRIIEGLIERYTELYEGGGCQHDVSSLVTVFNELKVLRNT